MFIPFLLLILLQKSVIGQENGEKHFYVNPSEEIKTAHFEQIKDTIVFTENTDGINTLLGVSSAIVGVIIGELVPILVEKVGLLAYNPKNYISEYGTTYLLELNALRDTRTLDKIVYARSGIRNYSNDTIISKFKFDLKAVSKSTSNNIQAYRAIALEEYQSSYTRVKLKNSDNKTNIVANVTLVYFDEQDKKQELNLQPYKLGGVIPRGRNSKTISIGPEKRNYQIIPPMKFIETVSIKITEVNDRKKDWDKYLELFNTQKGNISSFLIDQLK